MDDLGTISTFIKNIPFAFPFDGAPSFDGQLTEEELKKAVDFLNAASKFVTDHIRKSFGVLPIPQSHEEKITSIERYVAGLKKILIDSKRRQLIDAREARREEVGAFWKHALGFYFGEQYSNRQPLAFGPFVGPQGGEDSDLSTVPSWSSYPAPDIVPATLVCFIRVRNDEKLVLEQGGQAQRFALQRFALIGDRVRNETNRVVYAQLVMNDERPKDNNPQGSCLVYYRRIPLATSSSSSH